MWTMAELYPWPRVTPGLRSMYRGLSVAVCLILICVPCTDSVCNNLDADTCYKDALNKAQTVSCQSGQVIPGLRTCIDAAIGTCTMDVLKYWATRISDLKSSLDNIVATNTLTCSIACPTQAVETQKISDCSNGFSTLLDQIKTGGSNGENVSASCKKAQTAVTCLNNAGSCPTTVKSRNTLIASYNAVKKYCVSLSSITNPGTTSTKPLSDKPNQTALIIIGCLILIIIIVNVIIAIAYVYHRRQREMKKVQTRPMASRINYYQ